MEGLLKFLAAVLSKMRRRDSTNRRQGITLPNNGTGNYQKVVSKNKGEKRGITTRYQRERASCSFEGTLDTTQYPPCETEAEVVPADMKWKEEGNRGWENKSGKCLKQKGFAKGSSTHGCFGAHTFLPPAEVPAQKQVKAKSFVQGFPVHGPAPSCGQGVLQDHLHFFHLSWYPVP